MSLEVVWAEGALDRLRSILARISIDRPKTARRVINRLFDRAALLGEFPEMGRAFEGMPGAGVRQVVEGSYRLFYVANNERGQVVVLAVRHVREAEPAPDGLAEPGSVQGPEQE